MTSLKAHVMNGRIVVDEPVDLPDGAEDAMNAKERAAFEQALERSLKQADAGDLIEAEVVLAELQRP